MAGWTWRSPKTLVRSLGPINSKWESQARLSNRPDAVAADRIPSVSHPPAGHATFTPAFSDRRPRTREAPGTNAAIAHPAGRCRRRRSHGGCPPPDHPRRRPRPRRGRGESRRVGLPRFRVHRAGRRERPAHRVALCAERPRAPRSPPLDPECHGGGLPRRRHPRLRLPARPPRASGEPRLPRGGRTDSHLRRRLGRSAGPAPPRARAHAGGDLRHPLRAPRAGPRPGRLSGQRGGSDRAGGGRRAPRRLPGALWRRDERHRRAPLPRRGGADHRVGGPGPDEPHPLDRPGQPDGVHRGGGGRAPPAGGARRARLHHGSRARQRRVLDAGRLDRHPRERDEEESLRQHRGPGARPPRGDRPRRHLPADGGAPGIGRNRPAALDVRLRGLARHHNPGRREDLPASRGGALRRGDLPGFRGGCLVPLRSHP